MSTPYYIWQVSDLSDFLSEETGIFPLRLTTLNTRSAKFAFARHPNIQGFVTADVIEVFFKDDVRGLTQEEKEQLLLELTTRMGSNPEKWKKRLADRAEQEKVWEALPVTKSITLTLAKDKGYVRYAPPENTRFQDLCGMEGLPNEWDKVHYLATAKHHNVVKRIIKFAGHPGVYWLENVDGEGKKVIGALVSYKIMSKSDKEVTITLNFVEGLRAVPEALSNAGLHKHPIEHILIAKDLERPFKMIRPMPHTEWYRPSN